MSAFSTSIRGPSMEDLFKPFRSALAGQNVPTPPAAPTGSQIVEWRKSMFGGYPVVRDGGMSIQSQQSQQDAALAPQRAFNALLTGAMDASQSDAARLQGASDEQYDRLGAAAGDFKNYLGGVEGKINAGANAAVGTLDAAGNRILGMGDQAVNDFNGRTSGILPDLDKRLEGVGANAQGAIDTAREYGGKAITAASAAVAGFDSGFHQQIADSTAAIERRAVNDQKQWQAMAASGEYSHAEIDAARRKSEFDTTQQVGSVKAQLGMQYETTRASLGMALSGVMQKSGEDIVQAQEFAASTGEASAALRANVGVAISGQGLEAERLRQGYAQMFTGLASQTASVQSASAIAAVQAMMNGNQAYYQMLRENPRSVVSMLAGFMQVAQLATSPGGPAFINRGGGGTSFGGNNGGSTVSAGLRGNIGIGGRSPVGAGGNFLNGERGPMNGGVDGGSWNEPDVGQYSSGRNGQPQYQQPDFAGSNSNDYSGSFA